MHAPRDTSSRVVTSNATSSSSEARAIPHPTNQRVMAWSKAYDYTIYNRYRAGAHAFESNLFDQPLPAKLCGGSSQTW